MAPACNVSAWLGNPLGDDIPWRLVYWRSAVDTWGEKWELLVIDDGSTDATLAILQRLHAQDPRVKCISFSRKFGIALLLLCLAASIRHYRLGSDFRLRWINNGPAE